MSDTESLCPMCLRPALLLERGQDILSGVMVGAFNITRARDDSKYVCHGCGAEFVRPLKIKRSAIVDARVGGHSTQEDE